MTRQIHKPKSFSKGKMIQCRDRLVPAPDNTAEDTADAVSEDSECACEDDGGFKTTDWMDQNIGTEFHFQYMHIAGMEISYCGRKGHLTVHSRGEHRFNVPGRAMTREELTKFAVSCAFQVLSEQYGIFKSEALKMGCTLEA